MKQIFQLTNSFYYTFKKKILNYLSFGILTNATLMELMSLRSNYSFERNWPETKKFVVKEDIAPPNIFNTN